jgi:hypothetical protein
MDPRDKQNLQFILQADAKTLTRWWATLDEEDRMYALGLMAAHRLNLADEAEDRKRMISPQNEDLSLAQAVLQKFMLP